MVAIAPETMEESCSEWRERRDSDDVEGRKGREKEGTALSADERTSASLPSWKRKSNGATNGEEDDGRAFSCDVKLKPATEEAKDAGMDSLTPPNGGFGWCIVVAAFFVHVFVLGNIYSFGIFYKEYIDHFSEGKGAIAYSGSIGAALMGLGGAWSGYLSDRYGNNKILAIGAVLVGLGYLLASFSTAVWHLYLTQGLVTGVGYSLAYIAGISVVGQWFTTKRGLAVGVAVAGSGVGQFIMSMVSADLIRRFGWRGALQALAAINFVGLILCASITRRFLPLTSPHATDSWLQFFEDKRFCLIYGGICFSSLGMFMPYTYLPLYCEHYGLSKSTAVLTLSLVGISSAVGRVILGYASDFIGKIRMLKVCILFAGIATLCWQACRTFPTILVYGLVFGFFAGGTISLIPSVAAELFGVEKLGASVGALFTASSVGLLLSAPIGGFLLDGTGGYQTPIIVDAIFLLLGFAITSPMASNIHAVVEVAKLPAQQEGIGTGRPSGSEESEVLTREGRPGDAEEV